MDVFEEILAYMTWISASLMSTSRFRFIVIGHFCAIFLYEPGKEDYIPLLMKT